MNSLSDRSLRAVAVVRPLRSPLDPTGQSVPMNLRTRTSSLSRHRFDDELRDGAFLAESAAHADRAAWSAGYESGMTEGIACGRALSAMEQAAADRRAQSLIEHIATAANRVIDDQRVHAAAATSALLHAAFEIAEAIIGREVHDHPRSGADALLAALCLAPEHMACVARLNPADVDELGDASERFAGRDLTIVADATMAVGDCVVSLPTGRIEFQISEAVARARRVVLGELGELGERGERGERGELRNEADTGDELR